MKRVDKEQAVDELKSKFAKATAVILTDYRGLKVAELTAIRRALAKVPGHFKVVKNRLVKRALEGNEEKLAAFVEKLEGPVALAFTAEDPVALAKSLSKSAGEFEALKIGLGIVRGEVVSEQEVVALSQLPSKEELYAKLLGTLMAPANNLVRALNDVAGKLVRTLAAIQETKQETGSRKQEAE